MLNKKLRNDKKSEDESGDVGLCGDDGKPKDEEEDTKRKHEDMDGITWNVGTGRGRVRVEQVKKTDDAIRPKVLEGVQTIDPMDLFRSVGSMVGRVSLEFGVFKRMQQQYGRVILWVESKRLPESLPDGVELLSFARRLASRTGLAVTARRRRSGRRPFGRVASRSGGTKPVRRAENRWSGRISSEPPDLGYL